jgi:hypothetical protein
MPKLVEIETPIGPRVRFSCGEVAVPTYYGALRPQDKKTLARQGYPLREVRKASGIRASGALVVFIGSHYYEVGAPASKRRV